MLKIGDFSKLARISIRMLRHYDNIGLLIPKSVDVVTGYRYYDEQQLAAAEFINRYKRMGFGLMEIKEALKAGEDRETNLKLLEHKKEEMKNQQMEIKQRILLLDQAMMYLRKDGIAMNYTVELKELPKRYVASVRQILPAYDQEGKLWHIMMQETAKMNMKTADPSYSMAVFHDGEFKESDVDVEIQLMVEGRYEDTEHVKFKELEQIRYASATMKGSYEQITAVNATVAKWVRDSGYEFAGNAFEIYHIGPHETQNPDEWITEIGYPVVKK